MKKNTMNAVVCEQPGTLTLISLPIPDYDDSLVRIRVRRVGVCGTDFHIYKGLHPFLTYPRILGHELAGEVHEAPESSNIAPGDHVIVNPYIPCGDCIACRKARPNCCASIRVLGVHTDGGMCEFVDVPVEAVYPAGELSLSDASMVEFLSIGAHAIRRGGVSAEDDVLIVGAGPIGLGAGLFCSLAGATVAFLDTNPARIRTATELIPKAAGLETSVDLHSSILAHTRGELFDVVIDATGNRDSMQRSLDFVAHGGRCVYLSVVDADITFNDPVFHAKEMALLGSRNATRADFEYVVKCMHDGRIPMDALNTHHCQLGEVPERLPQWLGRPDSLIKGIVHI